MDEDSFRMIANPYRLNTKKKYTPQDTKPSFSETLKKLIEKENKESITNA